MSNAITEEYAKNHPKRDVAVVGLRDNEGNILLVRTHKLTDWWQPIGGGVDEEDDSPESAALREVEEEIGVTLPVESLRLVTTTPYDFGEGTVYFFEALVDRDTLHIAVDEHEIIDHQWFSVNDAVTLPAFDATKLFLKQLSDAA